jgi:hypothetical protein
MLIILATYRFASLSRLSLSLLYTTTIQWLKLIESTVSYLAAIS